MHIIIVSTKASSFESEILVAVNKLDGKAPSVYTLLLSNDLIQDASLDGSLDDLIEAHVTDILMTEEALFGLAGRELCCCEKEEEQAMEVLAA